MEDAPLWQAIISQEEIPLLRWFYKELSLDNFRMRQDGIRYGRKTSWRTGSHNRVMRGRSLLSAAPLFPCLHRQHPLIFPCHAIR